MKKLAIAALLLGCSITSFGKDGFYRAASFGVGGSMQNQQGIAQTLVPGTYIQFSRTTAWQGGMDIGYQLHNFRFVAGLQFLADGYKAVSYGEFVEPQPAQARFEHLNIPLKLGYQVNLSKKLALVPYVGGSVGYNFNVKQVMERNGETVSRRETNSDFDFYGYRRISFRATGQVDVRYQLCDMMAITAGPAYNMMLGSMQEVTPARNANLGLKLNSYTLNVGIELTMPKGGCCWHGCSKSRTGTLVE